MPYAPCSSLGIGLFLALAINEMEIAGIDKNPGALPYNEHRISPVYSIAEQNDSTGQAQIPKGNGNQATAILFTVNPLNKKSRAKCCLPYKAYDQPKGINFQSFLPPRLQLFCSAFAARLHPIGLTTPPRDDPKYRNDFVRAFEVDG